MSTVLDVRDLRVRFGSHLAARLHLETPERLASPGVRLTDL